jgi:hypothetical protein
MSSEFIASAFHLTAGNRVGVPSGEMDELEQAAILALRRLRV